jgi:enoyl-CoA hydratase/carnithine racemase
MQPTENLMNDLTQLKVHIDNHIATLTMDAPPVNALTRVLNDELTLALDRISEMEDVRVVILTGQGKIFCAGADLKGRAENIRGPGDLPAHSRRTRECFHAIRECAKPVIAAINGPAVGVGITMTLPMDVRFAAESAKIGFVFARRGIVPEAASSWFLPRVVGISQATEWCYSGRVFQAPEAAEAGLVKLVPDGAALDSAMELAREIATHSAPVSVALTRQMLWRGLTFDHPMQAHRVDSRAIQALGAMADAREGVTSFLEKRNPEWSLGPSTDTPDVFPDWTPPDFS